LVGDDEATNQLFDEEMERWFALPHPMAEPRSGASAVLLPATAVPKIPLPTRDAVARAQLEQVAEVIVAGCPQPECNGRFKARAAHGGWPRFENEHGWHLYPWAGQPTRGQSQWFINDCFAPDVDEALAFIESADGSLPVGQRNWHLTEPGDKTKFAGKCSVTISLQ